MKCLPGVKKSNWNKPLIGRYFYLLVFSGLRVPPAHTPSTAGDWTSWPALGRFCDWQASWKTLPSSSLLVWLWVRLCMWAGGKARLANGNWMLPCIQGRHHGQCLPGRWAAAPGIFQNLEVPYWMERHQGLFSWAHLAYSMFSHFCIL